MKIVHLVCYFAISLPFLLTNGQQERKYGQSQQSSTKNFQPLNPAEPSKINKKYRGFSQFKENDNLQELEPPKLSNTRNTAADESRHSYPTYKHVPKTSFSCAGKPAGYYADIETGCQAFRVCAQSKSKPVSSQLCPNGSIFNQATSACDWWRNVNCTASNEYYPTKNQLTTFPITQTSLLTTQAIKEQPIYSNYQQMNPQQNIAEIKTFQTQSDVSSPPHRFIPRIVTELILPTSSNPTTKTNRQTKQNKVIQRLIKSRPLRNERRYKYSKTEVKSRTEKPQLSNIENTQRRKERLFTLTTTEPSKPKTTTADITTYRYSFIKPIPTQRTKSQLLVPQQKLQTTEKPKILTTMSNYNYVLSPSTKIQQIESLPTSSSNIKLQNTLASEPNLPTTSEKTETAPVTFDNNYSLSQLLRAEQVTTIPSNNQLQSQNIYTVYQQNLPQLIETNQQIIPQSTFSIIESQNVPTITQQSLQNLPATEKSSEISESNNQQRELNQNQAQSKSSSVSVTESTDMKSETPSTIENQKILAITSGYNYVLPTYTQTQPPFKYSPTIDFKNSAALLSSYFNTDIKRPQGFSLPSTSSESVVSFTESPTETNSITNSERELEPEIATTPVPPTTLKLTSRTSQVLMQTPTSPTLSYTDKSQISENSRNSGRNKSRFQINQQEISTTSDKPSTTTKYTFSENPLLTTLPLQYSTIPLTTVTTLPDANILNQYNLNQGQLLLNNISPRTYTLSNGQITFQQPSQLSLNQGQLLLNSQGIFQPQNQLNLNQDQLLLNNQRTLQQQNQQTMQGQKNQKSLNQRQPLSNNQENQQQNQPSVSQAQLLLNNQQNQQISNQAQLLPNNQIIFQQQNPLSQNPLFINNYPQSTFALTNSEAFLQQQLNQGQLSPTSNVTPKPLTLITTQTNLQQKQKPTNGVSPKSVTISNNQGNIPQPQNPPPIQKANSESDFEIVPSLSFSFETPNERKEFADAVLRGNLFDATPNKDNLSLSFINQGFDYFPLGIQPQQQHQQQLTTIPELFTPTTSYFLSPTTLPQILLPQIQISARQPLIQQQVDITQSPLPKTTTQAPRGKGTIKNRSRRKQ